MEERAGDEGVEADADAEREGEEERLHQRIGAYGESETLVIMKWWEWRRWGGEGIGGGTGDDDHHRPPPFGLF